MEITETRVKLVNGATDRLKAYCSITIDECFVVRDLKVIEGTNGLFVAMPSRKLSARCPSCGVKNPLRTNFCNECGKQIGDLRVFKAENRNKLHADVAHPINADCREFIQTQVIEAFEAELERSKQPDYEGATYEDAYDDDKASSPYEELVEELKAGQSEGEASEETAQVVKSADEADEPAAEPASTRSAPAEHRAPAPTQDTFGAGLV